MGLLGLRSGLRVLGMLRSGRIVREIAGLRRAVEAQVALQALAQGVPNPLTSRSATPASKIPPEVLNADTPLGAYVEAERRREVYDDLHGAGAAARSDRDFMEDDQEGDAAGDAAARGMRSTVYPEDFQLPTPPLPTALRTALEQDED